ncbi:MAG: SpoIIE family protein phosphatase [Phycisphaerae bacterium]|nr:SpoIIE family protein phosphatase [Phycisphaerae bacterium]
MKNILLISDRPEAPKSIAAVAETLGYGLSVETDPRALFQFPDIRRVDLILIVVRNDDPVSWSVLQLVGETLAATHLPMVALGDDLDVGQRIKAFQAGACECLTLDLPVEELKVRLDILASTKGRFDQIIDQNIHNILLAREMRKSSERMNEELQLARRLQMDFLPRTMPEIGRTRFAARLYPAGWVAGDFYDVFRLDEHHVGFYIADAIGHGVPAALLTIFVKRSLQTKRIAGNSYELIPPHEALALLNADLVSADLHQSPFISMFYCIVHTQTGRLRYARAGHPRPLLLENHKPPQELPGDGPLLGVVREARFQDAEADITPAQRLLLYTDGVERCMVNGREGTDAFFALAAEENGRPLTVYLQALLDVVLAPRSQQPIYDDVTLVAMDLTE